MDQIELIKRREMAKNWMRGLPHLTLFDVRERILSYLRVGENDHEVYHLLNYVDELIKSNLINGYKPFHVTHDNLINLPERFYR